MFVQLFVVIRRFDWRRSATFCLELGTCGRYLSREVPRLRQRGVRCQAHAVMRFARTASWTRPTRTSRSTRAGGATTATTTTRTSCRTGIPTSAERAMLAQVVERNQADGQGTRSRLPHRHQRRRRQLLRDLPREGEARPAAAALPRGRRLELAAGGQQHREAGRRARARPAHRGRRLARDEGPAARLLQGAGAAPRHAAGSRVLRRPVQLRGAARVQVHPDRRQLLDRVRARAARVALSRLRPAPAEGHPSPVRARGRSRPSRRRTSSPTSCTTAS